MRRENHSGKSRLRAAKAVEGQRSKVGTLLERMRLSEEAFGALGPRNESRETVVSKRHCISAMVVLLLVTEVFALLFHAGSEFQSPENYKRWPGLADVVNHKSRVELIWCNGGEQLFFEGDTAALNETLAAFAKIKTDVRNVIFRPGPLRTKKQNGQFKTDWFMTINEGLARAHVTSNQLDTVHFIEPTLTIYVSPNLDWTKLTIPKEVSPLQIKDLETRYKAAKLSGGDAAKKAADEALQAINEDPIREKIGAEAYGDVVASIQRELAKLKLTRGNTPKQ